jgi:hypothetical protein
VSPMAGDVGTTNDDVEVVDFGSTGIVRCKRCRTYVFCSTFLLLFLFVISLLHSLSIYYCLSAVSDTT